MVAQSIYAIANIERRRARGYVASLMKAKKQLGRTGKIAINKKIREVERAVSRSYRGSGYSVEKATSEISALIGPPGKSGKARVNAVFQQQIGLASRRKKSSLGTEETGHFRVKAFYRATQRIWEKAPSSQRNQLIMQKLGVSTLSDAYDIVMSREDVRNALSSFEGNLKAEDTAVRNDVVDEFTISPPELGEIDPSLDF